MTATQTMMTETETMVLPGRRHDKRRHNRFRYRDGRIAYLLILPALVLLGIFVVWPAVYAGYLSFQDWSFYKDPEFVGWRNYTNVLSDPLFWESIGREVVAPGQRCPQRSRNCSRMAGLMSQPATTSMFGTAASAAAWLYGIEVPSTGSDAAGGGSVAIQESPMMAARYVVKRRTSRVERAAVPRRPDVC